MEPKRHGVLDHPLEPVIGLAEGETRWRMMTAGVRHRFEFQTAYPGVVARLDRAIQYSRDGSRLYEMPRRTGCPA